MTSTIIKTCTGTSKWNKGCGREYSVSRTSALVQGVFCPDCRAEKGGKTIGDLNREGFKWE